MVRRRLLELWCVYTLDSEGVFDSGGRRSLSWERATTPESGTVMFVRVWESETKLERD